MRTFLEYLTLARAGKADQIEDLEARKMAQAAVALVRDGDVADASEAEQAKVETERTQGLWRSLGKRLGFGGDEPKAVEQHEQDARVSETVSKPAQFFPKPTPGTHACVGAAFDGLVSTLAGTSRALNLSAEDFMQAMEAHGDKGGASAVMEALLEQGAASHPPLEPLTNVREKAADTDEAEQAAHIKGIEAIAQRRAAKGHPTSGMSVP